jgi:GntR family transcriptional regulator, transcriptional repressor for pyruvate dehydrogenase complex
MPDKVTSSPRLVPLARPKLATAVAEQLLDRIRTRRLPAGTRLPSERDLMAALGVGRSTVREAINGLAMTGVLEIRHGQGAFVLDPSVSPGASIATAIARGETDDLFEARTLVEPEAARLAAARRTAADVRALDEILADHRRAIEAHRSTVPAAVAFHARIAAASGNDVLAALVGSFGDRLAERGTTLETMPGFLAWELAEHVAVAVPIRLRDADGAALRMRRHLDAVVAYHQRIELP